MNGYYWPSVLARELPTPVSALAGWFVSLGFETSDNGDTESERVAIYGDVLGALHVARRPPSRGWLSKMGDGPDIEHDELDWIESAFIGQVQMVLARATAS